jgi:hypothetical protein
MCNEHYRRSPGANLFNQIPGDMTNRRIETRGHFIKENYFGMIDQSKRNKKTLSLSS